MTTATRYRIAVTVLLGLVVLLAPAALAGKGGKGPGGGGTTTSYVGLLPMDGATQAVHNGRVTFEVRTTATDRPFVGLRCWQGTAWVLDGYIGFFPGAMFDPWLTLDSPYWADGVVATCTARLFYYDRRGNQKVLTTLDFSVAP